MKQSIYFVATEFGTEVHHGPAVYTRNLWNLFQSHSEFDFHLIVLQSDVEHPRIHVPAHESGKRRGFYDRVERHISSVMQNAPKGSVLHVNSAHLIPPSIAEKYPTIVQINDTEVCQHQISLRSIQEYGLRRNIALNWRRKRENAVAKSSNYVVCNSNFTARLVKQSYSLPEEKVKRIYKAVELSPFLDELPKNPEGIKLIFIGSNWARKGVSVLIEAVGILKARNPQQPLIAEIYGVVAPSMLGKYQALTRKHGVEDCVRFLGLLARKDAPAAISNCSMLTLPSFEEGLGLVTIEAIATGIPVVGSQVGGIPEVINHADLGNLVEPGCAQSLADAIVKQHALEDTQHLVEQRKHSSLRFGTDSLADNISQLYDLAIKSDG